MGRAKAKRQMNRETKEKEEYICMYSVGRGAKGIKSLSFSFSIYTYSHCRTEKLHRNHYYCLSSIYVKQNGEGNRVNWIQVELFWAFYPPTANFVLPTPLLFSNFTLYQGMYRKTSKTSWLYSHSVLQKIPCYFFFFLRPSKF